MAEPDPKGKTLWAMLLERVHGNSNGQATPVKFHNPRDLRIGSPVAMAFANGPEYTDYNFTVQEIREYVRRIGGQEFGFTDYLLHGVNTKTFDADHGMTVRLRVVPNQAGGHDSLILRLFDEFAFTEDFLGVVKDTTGIFEATDDKSGVKDTFSRINDLRDSYEAAVLVISQTTPGGQVPPGKASYAKLEYWDYWRDMDIGIGKTAKEFVFVEMNSETGWFQIWRGREFFS